MTHDIVIGSSWGGCDLMQTYNQCLEVEKRGFDLLLKDFFERLSECNWRWVRISDGSRSKERIQKLGVDFILNRPGGRMVALETKCERKYTGNLFLEHFSNVNLGRISPGWTQTSLCDVISFSFLDNGQVIYVDFLELQDWLYGGGRFATLRCLPANGWPNKSVGYIVPIDRLLDEMDGIVSINAKDLRNCNPDLLLFTGQDILD